MSREVMQQALDALETIPAGGADLNQLALTVAGVTLALRAALAAEQPEPVAMILKGSLDSLRAYQRVDTALYRPGFEPEQEWCEPLYAAPPAAPSVPAGWKLVPAEPTKEMCRAAVVYANGNAVYKNVAAEALQIEEDTYSEVYIAMLDAAPEAPSAPAPQWIACSERMPDDDIQVLVWAIGQLFSDGNCWVAARAGDWFVDDDGRTVSGVTAWMDLPEAPSGEEVGNGKS